MSFLIYYTNNMYYIVYISIFMIYKYGIYNCFKRNSIYYFKYNTFYFYIYIYIKL